MPQPRLLLHPSHSSATSPPPPPGWHLSLHKRSASASKSLKIDHGGEKTFDRELVWVGKLLPTWGVGLGGAALPQLWDRALG